MPPRLPMQALLATSEEIVITEVGAHSIYVEGTHEPSLTRTGLGGDKRDSQLTPMLAGLKRDYAVVAINYRLSGEARFPALVYDVKAAIRWVRAQADRFLFDPDRIATWGGSADVVDLEDLSLGQPDRASCVQAVVDWFGPTDFLKMDERLVESNLRPPAEFSHSGANSPESLLLGQTITEIPNRVRAARRPRF